MTTVEPKAGKNKGKLRHQNKFIYPQSVTIVLYNNFRFKNTFFKRKKTQWRGAKGLLIKFL
jgi:hypothetical protein